MYAVRLQQEKMAQQPSPASSTDCSSDKQQKQQHQTFLLRAALSGGRRNERQLDPRRGQKPPCSKQPTQPRYPTEQKPEAAAAAVRTAAAAVKMAVTGAPAGRKSDARAGFARAAVRVVKRPWAFATATDWLRAAGALMRQNSGSSRRSSSKAKAETQQRR